MVACSKRTALVMLALTGALLLGLSLAPRAAYADSDVYIKSDTLVYCGGFYDFEAGPTESATWKPDEYYWHAYMYDDVLGTYDTSLDELIDVESADWFSGVKSSHMSLRTSAFTEGNQNGGNWEKFQFYCRIYDKDGKRHDSPKVKMHIEGVEAFENQWAKPALASEFAFSNAEPAMSSGSVTKLSMKVGQTMQFWNRAKTPSWLYESDPYIDPYIFIKGTDTKGNEIMDWGFTGEGSNDFGYEFKPTQAGDYTVTFKSFLSLGAHNSYDTGKSIEHTYQVTVTEPVKELVSSLSGLTINFRTECSSSVDSGTPIPISTVTAPESLQDKATFTMVWYKKDGSSWQVLDTSQAFEIGGVYRCYLMVDAKDDYKFDPDPNSSKCTMLKHPSIYENRQLVESTNDYKPYKNMSSSSRLMYIIRDFTVVGPSPDPNAEPFGWINNDGAWYFYGLDGYPITGWIVMNSKLYFFNDDGTLYSTKDGVTSILEADIAVPSVAVFTGSFIRPSVDIHLFGKTLRSGSDFKLTYKKNKNVGVATVTATGIGDFSDSISAYFTIIPKWTRITKLTGAKKAFTAKWKRRVASQATGYQLQYSTKSDFSNAKIVKIKGFKNTSKKVKKLKAKKKYYVRVCVYKKTTHGTYYSDWSNVETVKTK